MTKEIKYKALAPANNEWLTGYIVVDPQGKHRIYLQPFPDATSNTFFVVDPETICLGSGIPDKEGIEIFENDRVQDLADPFDTQPWIVRHGEFHHKGTAYNGGYLESPGVYTSPLSSKDSKYLKIVGNELTEKK